MSETATGVATAALAPDDRTSVYPLWLRLMHWVNAVAVIILILSGWRIYDATRFMFGFTIPAKWTLGGWLGGALQWHFALMWLLVGNALVYLLVHVFNGRFHRQFLPLSASAIWTDFKSFLSGHLSHSDIRRYNAVQKVAYLFAMADIVVLVLSGLVLFKSVQLPWLRELLGGYEFARRIHFWAMACMVGFIVVHVVMAVLVPRTIRAMVWGR
ncbi:cytochrome b/b6 domain-containing protein [Asticcacaulis solisilvae]|uniref:cytochrome b/b6 domain-containing protein n=1 Tax=Asticcacaulis solisilvae TaxID=1217274 RepID=UPI003FD731CA